jgi:MFS family permease
MTISSDPANPAALPPSIFRLLFACLAVVGIGNSMLFAVLPPIARQIGMADWTVSAIFSVSAVLWVVTSPVWGRVSDRAGRKPMIVLGLSAFALSTGLFAAMAWIGLQGIWDWVAVAIAMTAARCLFGAVGSATNPAVQAYVADLTAPEKRTEEIGAVTAAFAFGGAAGPAFAALLISKAGLLAPLWTVTVLALMGAVSAALFLPRVRDVKDRGASSKAPSGLWKLAIRPVVWPWLLFGVILSAVTAVMFQQLSFFFIDTLHVTPVEGATLVAVALACGALAQIVAQMALLPRLKLTPRGLMISGTIVTALGTGLTAWGGEFGVLVFAQFLIGLGFGLARPGYTGGASLVVKPEEQGAMAGLVVASNGAGFVVAPIFGAGLYHWISPHAPFVFCTLVLIGLALYGQVSKRLEGTTLTESPPDHPTG